MDQPLRLHPGIDVARAAADYARRGRTVIEPFLAEDSARRLHDFLDQADAWRRVVNAGEKVFEIARADWAAMAAAARTQLVGALDEAARDGFQYRFESIRVDDDPAARTARGWPLDAFATVMSAPPTLALLRRITAAPDLSFADAQGTAYLPGDFLTGHDDAVAGKHRRAAYVLGLCPAWRAEWGGLLLFDEGAEVSGVVPGFNRLTLFGVPQQHSVSLVAPFAGAPRYAVTGWLRATDDA